MSAEAGVSDTGAPILALTVRYIDAVFSALKRAGGRVATIGGEPVHLMGRNGRSRPILLVQNGLGTPPRARFRISRATVPGKRPETWGMIEAADVGRKPFHPRICDPGAAAFSLRVRGADAIAAQVRRRGRLDRFPWRPDWRSAGRNLRARPERSFT